jgi:hypothetical protein
MTDTQNPTQDNVLEPEALLDLPPAVAHGFRAPLAREVLQRFIQDTGLRRLVRKDELETLPTIVGDMMEHAKSSIEPCMFSMMGADLPGLIPQCLRTYPVWYFAIPSDMAVDIPTLVDEGFLYGCGGLTGDPWRNAVFLEICTIGQQKLRFSLDAEAVLEPSISFKEGRITNAWLASRKGCVVVVFDHLGTLSLTAYSVDDDTITCLQACESSSFQRPERFYGLANLQERTRAVEETGQDPECPPGAGNYIFHVYEIAPNAPAVEGGVLSVPERVGAPSVEWHRMEAAVGVLKRMTYWLPPALHDDSRVWLKASVTQEFYTAASASTVLAKVQRVKQAAGSSEYFVLSARVDEYVFIVSMGVNDPGVQHAYQSWATAGRCLVAYENVRNGRLLTVEVEWPPEFCGSAVANAQIDGGQSRARLSVAEAVVQAMAVDEGRDLICITSSAKTDVQWELES